MIKQKAELKKLESSLRASKSPRLSYFIEHKNRYLRIIELIKKYGLTGSVLEVGAYPFQLLYLLDRIGYKPIGLDFDIGIAKGNKGFIDSFRLNVKKCDILKEKFPLKDGQFSTVIFSEVIEHLGNPLNALFEINRVTKNEGVLILTTPNLYSLGKVIKYLLGKGITEEGVFNNYLQEYTYGYPGHIKEYSNYGIKDILKYAGFEEIETSYEYYTLPKSNRIIFPFYILFPAFRPYQIVVARKVRSISREDYLKKKM